MRDPWIIGLGVAMGVAMSIPAYFAAHIALGRHRSTSRTRNGAPWWMRAALPAAVALAPAVGRVLPTAWIARVGVLLRRADLDEAIAADEWLALPLVAAIGGVAVALVVGGALAMALTGAMVAAALPALWLRDRRRDLARQIDRELPRLLELLTLAVEAGCSLGAALRIGVESTSSGVLQRGLAEALREIHAGRSRAEALADIAARYDNAGLHAMIAAIVHADASGGSIAGLLRAQTVQRTEERFARAEKLAMESPVKLLAPLILCIFPCAFLVIGFPIASRLLQWV